VDTPRPSPRTNRTRRDPRPVLIGHAAPLSQVRAVEQDAEQVWRRVDTECTGRVGWAEVAHAFGISGRRAGGEPGGSRALPHFLESAGGAVRPADPGAVPAPRPRRVNALALLRDRPRALAAARKFVAGGATGGAPALAQRLVRAGAVVSCADAAELLAAAGAGVGGAGATVGALEAAVLAPAVRAAPPLLGYGAGLHVGEARGFSAVGGRDRERPRPASAPKQRPAASDADIGATLRKVRPPPLLPSY